MNFEQIMVISDLISMICLAYVTLVLVIGTFVRQHRQIQFAIIAGACILMFIRGQRQRQIEDLPIRAKPWVPRHPSWWNETTDDCLLFNEVFVLPEPMIC